ncbi:MAG: response regulator [Oscillospiraceae bacterium]
MIKVLIVDDEALMRKGLRTLINWEAIGCLAIGTAANGREAISEYNKLHHDIVISDIKMPVMDGIELSKYFFEQQLPAKMILLTAYEDFTFAKQAISYGVSEYVNKSGSIEEITAAVEKCVAQIEKERNGTIVTIDQTEGLIRSILDERIIDENEISLLTKRHNLHLDSYRILCMDLQQNLKLQDVQIVELREQIMRLVNSEFKTEYHSIFIKKDLIGIILFSGTDETVFTSCTELAEMFYSVTNFTVYIGISNTHQTPHLLVQAFDEAKCALAQSFYNSSFVYCFSNKFDVTHEYNNSEIFDLAAKLINEGNVDGIRDLLVQLFDMQKKVRLVESEVKIEFIAIFDCCKRSLNRLNKSMDAIGIDEKDWKRNLHNTRFFNDSSVQIMELTIDICKKIDELRHEDSNVASEALAYIDTHFSENITLKDIADAVHAHPSYLSRCFKQRTGQNIVETITQKRMELAKTIMKQGIYKVYEISDKVGINDATYFSHVFRKYTGMSPKDYIDAFSKK